MKSLPDMLQRSMIVHHAQHLHSPTIGEEIVMARTARTEADEAIDVTEKMQMRRSRGSVPEANHSGPFGRCLAEQAEFPSQR
jgi:hypothetical protein